MNNSELILAFHNALSQERLLDCEKYKQEIQERISADALTEGEVEVWLDTLYDEIGRQVETAKLELNFWQKQNFKNKITPEGDSFLALNNVGHHSFSVEAALAVGYREATVLQYLAEQHEKNVQAGTNFIDGHYWFVSSVNDFHRALPYFTPKEIRTILGKLQAGYYIRTGNHNPDPKDRTKWYALTQKACQLLEMAA